MENLHPTLQETHFRYLKADAMKDPVWFIKRFCSTETELELFRQDINFLIQAAGTKIKDHQGKFYRYADEYVYNHRKIIEAIECLWVFFHLDLSNLQLTDHHPLFQTSKWKKEGIDVKERLAGPAKHFRKLENKEINNVFLFLQDFFLFNDLNEWREVLDDLLSYAHIDESIAFESAYFSCELIPIASYLEKMVEALFLIAELLSDSAVSIPEKTDEHCLLNEHPLSYPETTILLNDANYIDTLVIYLDKFYHHIENESLTYTNGPVMLSEALEKELLTYFESFHPTFLHRTFQKIYGGYLEYIFKTHTVSDYQELRTLASQMDVFFKLLELAEQETKHWPQEHRFGFQELKINHQPKYTPLL